MTQMTVCTGRTFQFDLLLLLHLVGGEAEAQRGEMSFLISHSKFPWR